MAPVQAHPAASIRKMVSVRRSRRMSELYWWCLPLSPRDVMSVYENVSRGARAVVHPASALGAQARVLGAKPWPGETALVQDVHQLLRARDSGEIQSCSIVLFATTVGDDELVPRMERFHDHLEELPFTIAMVPDGDGRHHFCFRGPGQLIAALEHLALDRRFGGKADQVERALLQGLALRPNQGANLRLELRSGGATLIGIGHGGRRRICYLESGKGYTGVQDEMSFRDALGARVRESWRRFPLGVALLAGLPFYVGAARARSMFPQRNGKKESTPKTPGTPAP